jgi:hypothetical protein
LGWRSAESGYWFYTSTAAYRANLQPNELQDLAKSLSDILELQMKHGIKIRFNLAVEATTEGDLKAEATAELRNALDKISDAFY